MAANPYAGQGGAYIYDPDTETTTQTAAPTAPPTITRPDAPPVLNTTSGELAVVTDQS